MISRMGKPLALATASVCAIVLATASQAQLPDRIEVPGRAPESITSSADGAIYVGSIGEGAVYRAAPGAAAVDPEPFIPSFSSGLQSVFGVLADDATGTLWVCSGPVSFGSPPPGAPPASQSTLQAFDLVTGALKASYELPTANAACNDVAVAPDGTVFATDTTNMEVVRLPVGGDVLEVWSPAGAFGPSGGVLDGIAVVGDRVVVNTLATSKLFGVEIADDGSAGAVVEYALDRPIERPDGMRTFGDGVLVVEGGRLSRVVLDHASGSGKVTTIGENLSSPVAVTVVGETAYVLEGNFAGMAAAPDADVPPSYAVAFPVGTP